MVSLSNHERLPLRQAQGERGWDGPRARELTQLSTSRIKDEWLVAGTHRGGWTVNPFGRYQVTR